MRFSRNFTIAVIMLFLLLTVPFSMVRGDTITVNPASDLQSAINSLQPGDVLEMEPGNYAHMVFEDMGQWSTQRSELEPADVDWIIVRAKDPRNKPVIGLNCSGKNIIDFRGDCAYIKLVNLEISEQGLGFSSTDSSDGIKLNTGSRCHHLVFEGLYIHDIESVGFQTKALSGWDTHHLTIRYSELARTGRNPSSNGEIMYLGSNEGDMPLKDSLIEYNYLHDSQNSQQGDAIDMKQGAQRNIIRHNVFKNNDWSNIWCHGTGTSDPNDRCQYYSNVIYGGIESCVRIQGSVEIFNNIIISGTSAIYGFQITETPGSSFDLFENIWIYNNTIVYNGWIDGWGMYETIFSNEPTNKYFNNAFYSDPVDSIDMNNADNRTYVFGDYNDMADDTVNGGFEVDGSDFYPQLSGALIDTGSSDNAPAEDFNGTARDSSPDIGAYEYTGTDNPGWSLKSGIKGLETSITTPSLSLVAEDVTVTGTAAGAFIDTVEISINGSAWVSAAGTAVWSYTFDSTSYSDGQISIEVRTYYEKPGGWAQYSNTASIELLINNSGGGSVTLEVNDIEDSYIRSSSPDSNYGSANYIYCTNSGSSEYRMLVKALELDSLPSGVTVTGAVLNVYKTYVSSSSTWSAAYQLNQSWNESSVTWNSFSFPGDIGAQLDTVSYGDISGNWVSYTIDDYIIAITGGGDNNGLIIVGNDYYYGYSYSTEYSSYPERRPYIEVTFTLPSPDTTAPGNVSAFNAVGGDEEISLSWNNPGDADLAGIMIRRSTGSAPADETAGTLVYNGSSTNFTDTGLTNGIMYYYAAFAYDDSSNYASGTSASAEPVEPPDTTDPDAPVVSQPTEGADISGVYTFSGTAADNTGVVSVTIQINGDTPIAADLGTPGGTSTSFSADIDTSAYTGAGTITITASDGSNISQTVVNVNFTNGTGSGSSGSSDSASGCMVGASADGILFLGLLMTCMLIGFRNRKYVNAILLTVLILAPLAATDYFITPEDYLSGAAAGSLVSTLVPGDTVYLAPGNYNVPPNKGRIVISGKDAYHNAPYNDYEREYDNPSMWITIIGMDPNDRPVFHSNEFNNTIQILADTSYVKLINLEVSNGDDGIKMNFTGGHHVVIENCFVHDINSVGIGCQQGAEYMTFRYNEICRAAGGSGELMYLGSSDFTKPLHDSLIEFSHCYDTISAYCEQGDGIEIKGNGRRNICRYNVVHDIKYPGIFSYGNSGGPSDANIISGNIIWNSGDHGIQVDGNTRIFNNIIFDCYRNLGALVHAQNATYDWFHDIVIYNNTFYNSTGTKCFNLAPTFENISSNAFYNNASFDDGDTSTATPNGADIRDNVRGNLTAAASAFVNASTDPAVFDFYPASGSSLLGAAGSGGSSYDHDLSPRDGSPDAGALERISGRSTSLGIVDGFRQFIDVDISFPLYEAQVSGDVTVYGTAIGNVPVKRVEVKVDNSAWVEAEGTNTWAITLDSTSWRNGLAVIQARAWFDIDTEEMYTRSASVQVFCVNGFGAEILREYHPDIEDAYINANSTSTNYGSAAYMYNRNTASYNERMVFKVPELTEIPENAVIQRAYLLVRDSYANGTGLACEMYRLSRDWDESTVTWNTFTLPGDLAVLQDSLDHAAEYVDWWCGWDISEYIQHVRDGNPNYGIMTVPEYGWNAYHYSREYTSDTNWHPYMRVVYTLSSSGADQTPPSNISGLNLTPGDEEIELSWNNPGSDFSGVIVCRATGSAPSDPTDGTAVYAGTGTGFADSGLTNGTTYYYTVFAYDSNSNHASGISSSAAPSAGGGDTTPPAEAGSFTAAAGDTQITLSWSNPGDSDFAGVMIRRSTGSAPADETAGTLVYTGSSSPQIDTGLTNGTEYFYSIFTYDGEPNYSSGTSDSATPSTAADTTDPDSPSVSQPTEGEDISGLYTFSGTASDNNAVVSVTIQINGDTPVAATLGTPGGTSTTFSAAIDTSAYIGAGTVTITVSDGSNTSSTVVNVNFTNSTGGGGSSSSSGGCMPGQSSGLLLLMLGCVLMLGTFRERDHE